MAAYFLGSLLVIFHLPAKGPAADSLSFTEGLSGEQQRLWLLLYSVLAVLFFLAATALFRHMLLRRSRQKRRRQMAGRNHPAIPATAYETPYRQDPPEALKQAEPEPAQQEAPPAFSPPDEEEQAEEDYFFYDQLDRLEED